MIHLQCLTHSGFQRCNLSCHALSGNILLLLSLTGSMEHLTLLLLNCLRMIPSDRIPKTSKSLHRAIRRNSNLKLLFRDTWEAVKYPGSQMSTFFIPEELNKRIGGPSSHTILKSSMAFSCPMLIQGLAVASEYVMLFHRSALDLVSFATPKWILLAFSMTSLDIQLRCRKHLVAPVSNMGALLGLSDATPLLDATPLECL